MKYLNDLTPGNTAVIDKILTSDGMRRRLIDLGLTEGTEVACVGQSPAKDPKAYLIRGAVIALRSEDSKKICVRGED